MKDNKPWMACLKWGVVLGVMLALFEVVKMFARNVEFEGAKMFDLALIIAYVLILYTGVKELKEKYPERLSFAKAFLGCLIISITGSVLFFGYDMVHYAVIDPQGLEKKYESALNGYRTAIERDTITDQELNLYLDTVRVIMAEQEATVCQSDTLADTVRADIHRGTDMIMHFYEEKLLARRSADTVHQYQLSNFPAYSRRVLVETLALYVAQNEKQPSTPCVQQTVQQTCTELNNVNPANTRFEKNKSRVPHYDKPGRFAGISAMMNLLYGMFFGIFVAMYHYRSKNPIEKRAEGIDN